MILPSLSIVPYAHNRAGNMFTQFPLDGGFTVSSSDQGTIVNADGIIERSPRNLCINTQNFTAGSWAQTGAPTPTVINNVELAPDGTMTAALMTNGQIQYAAGIGVIGKQYTCSLYIRRISGTGTVRFRAIENVNTPVSVTSEWQRFSLTVAATTVTLRIGINLELGTSTVAIWGAQIEESLTPTAYQRVDASRLNFPRIDWLGQSCPALLVEASGQNGILNSDDTTTNWSLGANLSRGAIDVIGVSGSNITVAVSGSNIGASAGRTGRSSNNVALASGSTYTISFFVKTTGTHTIGGYYAVITGAASGDLGAGFNVSGSFSSGSIFNTAGTTNRIRRVEQWGTDVYRCSETFTMTASGTLTIFYLAPLAGVTSSSNSAAGSQLGFAAPQIELGAFPTSFIPTTSGAVSRAADVINASGVSGLIGQTEGTIYAEVDVRNFEQSARILAISDGTTSNRITLLFNTSSRFRLLANVSASGQVDLSSSAQVAGIHKIAVAYKENDYAFYLNGSQVGTDTSALVPACSSVFLGKIESSASTNFLNDRIRAAALYTTRLDNYELMAMTSLDTSYEQLAARLSYAT